MSSISVNSPDISTGGGGDYNPNNIVINGGSNGQKPGPSQSEIDHAKQLYTSGHDYAEWSYENHIQPNTHYASHSTYSSGHFAIGGGTYDLNDKLFHSSYDIDLLLQSNDLDSLKNPYSKKVDISYSADNVGRPIYVQGDNPAYKEFEQQLADAKEIRLEAQRTDYQNRYDAGEIKNNEEYLKTIKNLTDGHSNGLYGSGTLGIDALAQNIASLKEQISDLEMADSLSSDYSRIDNTDHSKEIDALKAQLGEFQKQYESAINDYNARYAIAKSKQNDASKGEWNISYTWISEHPFDAGSVLRTTTIRQDTNGFSNIFLNGDINSWMAGGSLYDAPRAGDVMFNVMGNMNTVRFLGLEDTNKIPDMVVEFANPEVFRMLGNMAGDNNFSVIPPTMYS